MQCSKDSVVDHAYPYKYAYKKIAYTSQHSFFFLIEGSMTIWT